MKSSYRNRVARLKGDAKSTDSDRTRFGDARHKESERPRTNVRGESGIASRPNALSALEPVPAEAFTPGIMMLMPRSQDIARLKIRIKTYHLAAMELCSYGAIVPICPSLPLSSPRQFILSKLP